MLSSVFGRKEKMMELDEQERERRRRERIRRERMRRRRQMQMRVVLVFAILVIILVLCLILANGGKNEVPETLPVADTTTNPVTDPPDTEPQQTEPTGLTADELAALPKDLQYMYQVNVETHPFVMGYWENKNKNYEIDLSEYMGTGEVAPLMQWDERWGYHPYAGSLFGRAGCGPMCLSLAAMYFTENPKFDPIYVADYATEHGYASNRSGTEWSLITYGAADFGLQSKELPLDEQTMVNALQSGKLIICVMGPGDFTESGHFILVTGYKNGAFTVWDTNRRSNSEKTWTFDQIKDQINNLWSVCAAN